MSIGFVILSMLVMGILDLGRAYFLNLALEDAAGEAALYLSLYPTCPDERTGCPGMNNAQSRAVTSGGGNVDWSVAEFIYEYLRPSDSDWSSSIPANPIPSGTLVRVTIRVPYQVLTPVVSGITRTTGILLGATAISVVVQ